jgi:uncharacterized protein (DUF2141 family)
VKTTIKNINSTSKITTAIMKIYKPILFTILCCTLVCCKQSSSAPEATIATNQSDSLATETKTADEEISNTKETKDAVEETTLALKATDSKADVATTSKTKASTNQKPLTIIVTNLTSADATVVVGLYGTKNKFPKPKGELKVYRFKPSSKELKTTITDLKYGTYALAIYQDVNSNKKIDKNMIGIPTEAYAFSNNYKPTVKAPNFNDCKFLYNAKTNSVTMKMIQ